MNLNRNLLNIFIRYLLIVIFGLGNFYILYNIFNYLTLNGLIFVLNFFGDVSGLGSFVFFNNIVISLIPACIGVSAYYLLFIFSLSIKDIDWSKRLKMLLMSCGVLYLLNMMRLVLLVLIYGNSYFDLMHWVFWYLLSTLFVVGICISMIYFFELKSIPLYSDLKYIFSLVKKSKKTKTSSKH